MKLTGGQAVVETLRAGGVTTDFGIPGAHNLTIYEALRAAPDIRYVLCRHEQAVGFASDGYSRTSGVAGVFVTTTEPGTTKAFTAPHGAVWVRGPLRPGGWPVTARHQANKWLCPFVARPGNRSHGNPVA